jgi:hypothetical protein
MNCIDIRTQLPVFDQHYVVSITKNDYTFLAIAHFEQNEWFYVNEGEKGDRINDRINGWIDNLAIYTR